MFEQSAAVDVEPLAGAPAAPASNYWYYCTDPAGYYPYVGSCNQAWIPVVPQPTAPRG